MTLGVDCAFVVVPREFALYPFNGIEHNKFIGLPSSALRRGRRVPEALLCVSTRLLMLRVAVAALHDSKTAAGVGR